MVQLPKPPSQFKNLFWYFRFVRVAIFPRQLIHLLLYLLAGSCFSGFAARWLSFGHLGFDNLKAIWC